MKFLFVLITTAALLFATACTKDQAKDTAKDVGNALVCAAQETVLSATTVATAAALDCKKPEAIKAYLVEKANAANLCKKDEAPQEQNLVSAKSVVGDLVCQTAVSSLKATALAKIPAEWECTGGQVTADAEAKILAACQKAL